MNSWMCFSFLARFINKTAGSRQAVQAKQGEKEMEEGQTWRSLQLQVQQQQNITVVRSAS